LSYYIFHITLYNSYSEELKTTGAVLARRVQSRPPPNSDQKISNNEWSHPSPLPSPYKASQPRRQYNCLVILTPRVTHKILFQRVQFTVFFQFLGALFTESHCGLPSADLLQHWTPYIPPQSSAAPVHKCGLARPAEDSTLAEEYTRPTCGRVHGGMGVTGYRNKATDTV